MPAFTFEKISPPSRPEAQPAPVVQAASETRGVIIQMLDRMTSSRLEREARSLRLAQSQDPKFRPSQ